jgi:hypothetical protein
MRVVPWPVTDLIISADELTGRVLPFLAGLFEDRPLLEWPQRSILTVGTKGDAS